MSFAAVLLVVALGWRGQGWLDSLRVVRSLGGVYDPAQPAEQANAWLEGWQRLCPQPSPPVIYTQAGQPAASLALHAALATGDYPAARLLSGSTLDSGDGATAADLLSGNWLAASTETEPAGLRDVEWGTVLYLAGQQAAAAGDFARAGTLLQQAEPLYGEQGPLASPALSECLSEWGRPEEATAMLRRASPALLADDSNLRLLAERFGPGLPQQVDGRWQDVDRVEPQYALSPSTTQGGWTAVGIDVNGDDLRDSPVIRTSVYWTNPDHPGQVRIDSTVVRNLVANGAFAWDYAEGPVHPFGFTASIYHNAVPVDLTDTESVGKSLCLRRLPDEPGIGLEGAQFQLVPATGSVMVQGGAFMSPDGAGLGLGRRWLGSDDTYPYSYLRQDPIGPSTWTRQAGAFTLSSGATGLRAWLVNYGPGGTEACFANLFLFALPPPA